MPRASKNFATATTSESSSRAEGPEKPRLLDAPRGSAEDQVELEAEEKITLETELSFESRLRS